MLWRRGCGDQMRVALHPAATPLWDLFCHWLMEMTLVQVGTGWGSWCDGWSNASIEWM